MKTLTLAEAQKRLPSVLEQVKQGQDVGIIAGEQIIQLKPVHVVAWEESYLYPEYNVTPPEWERFKRRIKTRRAKADYAEFTKEFEPASFA
jgi:hypothetical protein